MNLAVQPRFLRGARWSSPDIPPAIEQRGHIAAGNGAVGRHVHCPGPDPTIAGDRISIVGIGTVVSVASDSDPVVNRCRLGMTNQARTVVGVLDDVSGQRPPIVNVGGEIIGKSADAESSAYS